MQLGHDVLHLQSQITELRGSQNFHAVQILTEALRSTEGLSRNPEQVTRALRSAAHDLKVGERSIDTEPLVSTLEEMADSVSNHSRFFQISPV